MKTIDIYCLHHTPAKERKEYLIANFNTSDWVWVEDYLPTEDFIKSHTKIYSEHAANRQGYLNNQEISLFYKHKLAISKISEKNNFGLIVEDDIMTPEFNLIKTLDILIKLMDEADSDILFVGSYGNCDLKFEEPTLVCNNNTLSRCAHAYILNPKCSNIFLENLSTIKHPFDWQLNHIIDHLGLNSCWSYPHIYQRSEKKQTGSLLR